LDICVDEATEPTTYVVHAHVRHNGKGAAASERGCSAQAGAVPPASGCESGCGSDSGYWRWWSWWRRAAAATEVVTPRGEQPRQDRALTVMALGISKHSSSHKPSTVTVAPADWPVVFVSKMVWNGGG
jgi:hypothetical protein